MRLRLVVRGAVQGVGFRPFVYRLARELKLAGWIVNSAQGVLIEVEGPPPEIAQFRRRLPLETPAHALMQSCEISSLEPIGEEDFLIRESTETGGKTALILPDLAPCADCLREIFDSRDRRCGYPFTNCTNCGPRFSIIEALPYDRGNTSMRRFAMCADCAREYGDPADRRFHAEPTACPRCGPQLEFWNSLGEPLARGDEAMRLGAEAIRAGKVVALKGVGGFQLIVDARNRAAVLDLRERKHRAEKPFAVMFPTLERVRGHCEISELEERLLTSAKAPIVLLRRSPGADRLDGVAPGNPNLGAMLPSSPLHQLLLRELDFPVVATSGNLSDEPICIEEREALVRLRGLADCFLVHDRPIVRHIDDSVVRVIHGEITVLRRARGYAPLPVLLRGAHAPSHAGSGASPDPREQMAARGQLKQLGSPHLESSPPPAGEAPVGAREGACAPPILAVGAHLKNCVALSVECNVFLSQHIGDLSTQQAHEAFLRSVADLPRLYEAQPAVIAHDLHPDYLSTKHALQLPGRKVAVQHHWAHIASCMAEHALEPPLLGVAWDGTGYGTDGTIWGGEFFLVEEKCCRRFGHLRTFRLPGGDAAVKEPRRSALGLLYEIFGEELWERSELLRDFTSAELKTLRGMLGKQVNSPLTSSAGRLFDGVAALAGLRTRSTFEGQAAMELEFAIDPLTTDAYPFELHEASPLVLDWEPAIRAIIAERDAGKIAARFHHMLVEMIVGLAQRAGQKQVVLSGGCFQNRYLTECAIDRLRAEGFEPFWPQQVPPNDGGIALGQVYLANSELRELS